MIKSLVSIDYPVHQIENYIKEIDDKKRDKLAIVLGVTQDDLLKWHNNTNKLLRPHFARFVISKFIQTGNASWATFVTALRHPEINELQLAKKIATKHHSKYMRSKLARLLKYMHNTGIALVAKPAVNDQSIKLHYT